MDQELVWASRSKVAIRAVAPYKSSTVLGLCPCAGGERFIASGGINYTRTDKTSGTGDIAGAAGDKTPGAIDSIWLGAGTTTDKAYSSDVLVR